MSCGAGEIGKSGREGGSGRDMLSYQGGRKSIKCTGIYTELRG